LSKLVRLFVILYTSLYEEINYIINSKSFSIEEIPGDYDLESKRVVIMELIQEGVLTLQDH
ncbi:hypothetical protein, partial [Fulvivirga imtechensis]|uniref:hypothetical protein n=1 Tax=Fulvivirga imtechensis TaxID=881893 RepID=UPI00058C7171